MVALLVVALALALDNFAASIGIGVSGVQRALRLRVALIFGLFETAMPVIGLLLGRGLATDLGSATRWTAGGLLAAVGVYQLTGLSDRETKGWSGWRLVIGGAALSLDNLAVGFALGTRDAPVIAAIVVFGVVSIGMSLAGLELGARIGARAGDRGELLAAILLIAVAVAIVAGWF